MISGSSRGNTIKTFLKYSIYIFILSLFLTSCGSTIDEVNELVESYELSQEKADRVTIIYSKEGHTKAKLTTKTFIQMKDAKPPYVEMKDGVKVEFFDDALKTTSTLTSKYGRYFETSKNVLVRDSVVVENNKMERLETEELIWNEKQQLFFTDKYVTVTTPVQKIYGDGLEANQDFSWYKITNVKGIISVQEKSFPKIQ